MKPTYFAFGVLIKFFKVINFGSWENFDFASRKYIKRNDILEEGFLLANSSVFDVG